MLFFLGLWMTALLPHIAGQDLHSEASIFHPRSLAIEPKTIRMGETATLSWCKRDVSEILLHQAAEPHAERRAECLHLVGRFPSQGSLQVSPRVSTTYVVSCADVGTTCAESITITVR